MADQMYQSLLERLAERTGCIYLSDLSYLQGVQREHLIKEIKLTPVDSATLSEWNDTLEYLTQTSPVHDADIAKQTLVFQLSSLSARTIGEN